MISLYTSSDFPLAPTDFAAEAKYLRFEKVETVGAVIEVDIVSTVGHSSELFSSSASDTVEISKHFEGGWAGSAYSLAFDL